jgi:hypothetical protein
MDFSKLKEPFFPDELEWKPQSVGKSKGGKFWVKSLAYVTNRAIMDRLDTIVGAPFWKNEYRTGPEGGVLCGLSIKIGDEWVTKWDGSENTDIEAVKGGLSGAMKRAGVQWGIGRYLYDLEETFGDVREDGILSAKTKEGEWFKWNPPKLPAWAIPGTNQTKVRGATPPPSEPVELPPGPPPAPQAPVDTKLYRLKDFLNTNKDRFTSEQAAVIRKDLAAAGTTDALLDALRAKADGFLAANDKATQEAFEAGGFTPEP